MSVTIYITSSCAQMPPIVTLRIAFPKLSLLQEHSFYKKTLKRLSESEHTHKNGLKIGLRSEERRSQINNKIGSTQEFKERDYKF